MSVTFSPFRRMNPVGNPLYPNNGFHFSDQMAGKCIPFVTSGVDRLFRLENYGYTIWSLADPASPVLLGADDMTSVIPQAGDGQSITIDAAIAPDGSRALVNWKQSPYGTFLMKPTGGRFSIAGDFGNYRSAVEIVKVGARYLGYAMGSSALLVADVTAFVSPLSAAIPHGSVASSPVPGAPTGFGMCRAGGFLVYTSGSDVIVIDCAAGAASHATTGAPRRATAAIHPTTGRLWIAYPTASGYAFVSSADGLTFVGEGLVAIPSGTPILTAFGPTLIFAVVYFDDPGSILIELVDVANPSTSLGKTSTSGTALAVSASSVRALAHGDAITYYLAGSGSATLSATIEAGYALGDINGDGAIDVKDVFYLANFLFARGPAPKGSADVDGDGTVNVTDLFYLARFLFAGGPPPKAGA